MGKRRRRGYGTPGGFWRQEIGGAPYWFIGLAVLAMAGIGTYALVAAPTTPTAASTPRPIPTFTYSDRGPQVETQTIVVIGDSYTGGSPMNSGPEWYDLVQLDNARITALANGGTGYVATNEAGSGDATFATVAQEIPATADTIVFFGSRNDADLITSSAASESDIRQAAEAAFQAAAERAPQARLVVVGPVWVSADIPSAMRSNRDAVKSAAEAVGADWVDPLEEQWFADDDGTLIGADGVHPTDPGHQYLASKLAPLLTSGG